MKAGGDDAAGDGVLRGRDAEEKDDFGSEETDAEVDMDDIPLRLDLLAEEYGDGQEHRDDRDGEADLGDEVEVRVVHRHRVLVDVEDEGEVGEVAAGAHCVAAVVTHRIAAFPGDGAIRWNLEMLVGWYIWTIPSGGSRNRRRKRCPSPCWG